MKNEKKTQAGKLGGIKGGRARAQILTKQQRIDIARKAASVRWSKQKEKNMKLEWTKVLSQSAQILKALKNGEKLTHLDAERRFNCLRLGARIHELKKRGYEIKSQMITVPNGKRVAQYSMVV